MEAVHIKLLLLIVCLVIARVILTFASARHPVKSLLKLGDLCDMGIIAGLVTLALISYVFRLSQVQGESMLPSLQDGEMTVVNRLIYRMHSPQRGDIIVFMSPVEKGEDYIKRVIGLPGETLSIENGWVIVNGLKLNEPYLLNKPDHSFSQITIPAGHYFVMGDNRQNSADSRTFDAITRDSILGKASLIIWPPHDWGMIQSNKGRLFLANSP
jgi:signal peptidase I